MAHDQAKRPARRVTGSGAWCTLTLAGALIALHLSLPGMLQAQEGPNNFERQQIEEEAVDAFRRMITLWREELYFELYEEGWEDSRKRIPLEEFAQRMVELAWVPAGELDAKFFAGEFRHRTMVYIRARIRFQNRFNPEQSFIKDFATLLLNEGDSWRIDLIQIIRAPYA